MHRLTDERSLIKYVLNMCELHMRPNMLAGARSSIKATNKMFDASIDPAGLICMAMADELGRIAAQEPTVPASNEEFLRERLNIFNEYMSRPFVEGKDLIDAGLTPGREFSQILEYAHKLRLAGVDKKDALAQVLRYAEDL